MRLSLVTLLLAMMAITSCGNKEKVAQTDMQKATEEAQQLEDGWVKATVTDEYASEGCNFMLQMDVTDASLGLLNPVSLDEKYQKNGMRVKLKYQRTRMQQPSDCTKGILVIVNEIEKL